MSSSQNRLEFIKKIIPKGINLRQGTNSRGKPGWYLETNLIGNQLVFLDNEIITADVYGDYVPDWLAYIDHGLINEFNTGLSIAVYHNNVHENNYLRENNYFGTSLAELSQKYKSSPKKNQYIEAIKREYNRTLDLSFISNSKWRWYIFALMVILIPIILMITSVILYTIVEK